MTSNKVVCLRCVTDSDTRWRCAKRWPTGIRVAHFTCLACRGKRHARRRSSRVSPLSWTVGRSFFETIVFSLVRPPLRMKWKFEFMRTLNNALKLNDINAAKREKKLLCVQLINRRENAEWFFGCRAMLAPSHPWRLEFSIVAARLQDSISLFLSLSRARAFSLAWRPFVRAGDIVRRQRRIASH